VGVKSKLYGDFQGLFMVQEAFSPETIEGDWWTFWFKESGAVFFLMELD
jgi:hypothetical protein